MDTSSDSLLPEANPVEQPPWRWSWPARLGFVGAGVVSPLVCFLTAILNGLPLFKPWQSGELRMYAGLLFTEIGAARVFFPFLLYSMISLMLVTFRPHRFGQVFVVRVGVYTGVLLAVQYATLMVLYLSYEPGMILASALAIGIPLGVGGAIHWVSRRFRLRRVWYSVVVLLLVTVFVWFLICLVDGRSGVETFLQSVVGVPYFLCLFFGTPWAVAAYSIMSMTLVRRFASYRMQMSLMRLMGVFTWISLYMAAWRVSINQMLEAYAELPLEQPPTCYICTAAARGHSTLVRSDVLRDASGGKLYVNHQMRILKCAELILSHLAPPVHRACRGMYDRLGPPLAAMLVHPLLADAAYLAFKLPEWAARVIIRVVLPRDSDVVQRIY